MAKKIIYTNEIGQTQLDEAKESLMLNIENPTENQIWEEAYELSNMWLENEKGNLDTPISGIENILVIAGLGLWSGEKSGYKVIESTNLNSIFEVGEEFNTYFMERGNVKAECVYHDGTNHYLFRGVKEGVNIDILLNKIYNGTATRYDINRYTKSLYKEVKQIYG